MNYFDVYVIDRITNEKTCVLSFGTRTEAGEIVRFINKFDACNIEVVESSFIYKKGKHEV